MMTRRTYCVRGLPVRRSSLNGSSNFDEDQGAFAVVE
jgi:hypothetical protein